MLKNSTGRKVFINRVIPVLSLLVLAQSGCSSSTKPPSIDAQFNQLFEEYFEQYLRLNPIEATAIGDRRFDAVLNREFSQEHREQERKWLVDTQARLKALGGCAELTGEIQISCMTLDRELQLGLELMERDPSWYFPIHQFGSYFSDFAEWASGTGVVTFESVIDYENFLKRAAVFPKSMDDIIGNMRAGSKQGYTLPAVLVKKVIGQIRNLKFKDVTASLFYRPVLNIKKFAGEAEAASIESRYQVLIQEQIWPAYERLERFLEAEYLPLARKSTGYQALPGGRRAYSTLARWHTTTEMGPEAIMNIGLAEVARIRLEFEKLKVELGFKGTLKEFFAYLKRPVKELYPFETADEVLNSYRSIEAKIAPKVKEYFSLKPKAKFEIRQVDPFKAESASEAYQGPTADGKRPGIFWVPVPQPKKYAGKGMESLFLHEAIPGHHFQIAIQQELTDLPRFRRFGGNTAYVEGWALYTESLGRELGLYQNPIQWAGRLTGEMHRAIRLVVDTGMHWKGWSREKAIEYSLQNEPADEAEIVAEIERYMVLPGQALSYKIGELKIQELRKKAKEELGSFYRDSDFHERILGSGSLPLSVLETKVKSWIQSVLDAKARRPN